MNKTVFLFPGQGAQYVGMGRDFYDAFAVVRESLEEASDLLSKNLQDIIFNDAEALSQTQYSQIAIFAVSAAILKVVRHQFPDLAPAICAGLSLGEYTALFAAGKIGFASAAKLVAARGLFMQEACLEKRSCMRVVLGLDLEVIKAHLPEDVWIANLNCPGQVVIAGLESAMPKAEEVLKAQGARRLLPLDVSGAFHTPLMRSAQLKLEPQLKEMLLQESGVDLVMNVTGDFARSLEEMRGNLIDQVISTTHWEKGIRTIDKLGPCQYIEMGPGRSLAGMNKKIGTQGQTLSVEKVIDLEALDAQIRK